MNPKKIYKRLCNRCEKMYQPTGKYQKFCKPCQKIIRKESNSRRYKNG